jgi:hypothetical protein
LETIVAILAFVVVALSVETAAVDAISEREFRQAVEFEKIEWQARAAANHPGRPQ